MEARPLFALDPKPHGVQGGYTLNIMQTLRACVRNGRLVLDEPTDLPEGHVVELVRADEVLNATDDLEEAEREELRASIRESIRQANEGNTIDAADALADIRRHR